MKKIWMGLVCLVPSLFAETIPESHYNKTVFQDDFSEGSLNKKKWRLYKSSSVVKNEVLIGIEEKDGGHAAVHGTLGLDKFSDVEVKLDVRFEGSRSTNLAFNEKGFKGSHAGHICRVILSPKKVILRDGKTGNFSKEIYEKKKAVGKFDEATKKFLKTKETSFPLNLENSKWYQVTIRVKGDSMQLWIDDKFIGGFESEGIAHASKNNFAMVTPKQEVHYDNIRIKTP